MNHNNRIINFDFLRGLFVIMALYEHFAGYINYWYIDFFNEKNALNSVYQSHLSMIGQKVPIDQFFMTLATFLIPWVSQIYITLAAFNLANRRQEDFIQVFPKKLKSFGMIYLFFFLEAFIIAPNYGEAISFYPLMLWMMLLALLAIFYRYFGIRGIMFLTVLSLVQWIYPIDDFLDSVEHVIQLKLHPDFEFDARLDDFLSSACFGFLIGYVYHHYKNIYSRFNMIIFIIGAIFTATFYFFGDPFPVNAFDIYQTEHDMVRDFLGNIGILGLQFMVITFFLYLENRKIILKWPLFHWVGVNSILVFACHKTFFVRFIGPTLVFITGHMGTTLSNNFIVLTLCVLVSLTMTYIVKKSKVIEMIFLQPPKHP